MCKLNTGSPLNIARLERACEQILPLALSITAALGSSPTFAAPVSIPASTATVVLPTRFPGQSEFLVETGTSISTTAGNGIQGNNSQIWSLTNRGSIVSVADGVSLGAAGATVQNDGFIQGARNGGNNTSVFFSLGGSFNQGTTGVISGRHGVLFGSGALAGSNAGTIAGTGNGLWARGGASGAFVNTGSISTSGAGTDAVRAEGGAIITLTGTGSISATGNDSNGLAARGSGSTINAQGVAVNASGPEADGVAAYTGATITFSNGTTATSGLHGSGLLSTGENASLTATNVIVNTSGEKAYAVRAAGKVGGIAPSTLVMNGGAVTTSGLSGFGLLSVTGTQLTANNVTVVTSGSLGVGATAQSNASLIMNGGSITTSGDQAVGLLVSPISLAPLLTNPDEPFDIEDPGDPNAVADPTAQGGASLTANGVVITTTGSEAHGARVRGGSVLTLKDSTITARGVGANAVDSTPFDLGAGTLVVDNSTLTSLLGAGISVSDTTLNSTLSGSSLSGGAAVVQAVNSATLNLTATSSTLTGAAFTEAGSTSNITLVNSTWNLTGSSNLTNLVNDPSLIDFAPPSGGAFKTLTVNNYSGDGTLALNTFLGDDGSPSDKLVIDGGTATGSSALSIKNTLGQGALTTGNGILVVDAINNGSTSPSAFALAGPVYAGPYEYTLHRSSADGTNEQAYYLRSDLQPDPPTPVDPASHIPNFRPQTSLYAALPALALVYSRNIIDTLHERVGEERLNSDEPLPSDDEKTYGPSMGWGRVIYRSGEEDGDHNAFGRQTPEYNYDMTAFQVGSDLYGNVESDGSHDQAGVSLAIGTIDGGIKHSGLNAGDDTLRAYSLGGYWTHFEPSGWYVDGVVQVHRFDIEAKPNGLNKLETRGWGYTASVESGYPIQADQDFYIEPQAQLVYSQIDLDDSDDLAADVRFDDIDSLIGRLGVRFAKDWDTAGTDNIIRRTNGWIRPSVWHEFKGQPKTEFSSQNGFVPFEADLDGTWGEVNMGVDYQANARTTFTVSAGYRQAFDNSSRGYDGMVGFRIKF